MNCVIRPGIVIKYTDYERNIYYYVLNDTSNGDKVESICISSIGDLLSKAGYFVVDSVLNDYYEIIRCNRIMDCRPEEGELYLYKSRYTDGEWKVLKYTKFSIGYCFDSITDGGKYNLPGSTFVYPLTGLTESMVKGTCGHEAPADVQDKLSEEYSSLREEYEKLGDDYDELFDSHNELVSDYRILREQRDKLEKEVDSLKKENEKLKTMNEVKTEAIENYIHPNNCKYWDGEYCLCETEDTKPYKEEIERLKNLVIKLTEELMERR